jgi:hypothetical protein
MFLPVAQTHLRGNDTAGVSPCVLRLYDLTAPSAGMVSFVRTPLGVRFRAGAGFIQANPPYVRVHRCSIGRTSLVSQARLS